MGYSTIMRTLYIGWRRFCRQPDARADSLVKNIIPI